MNIQELVQSVYGGKIRIRVCGVLIKENKLLLINHAGLNKENIFWNFPGGGVEELETIENCLKREFIEEVNIEIEIKELCYINEVIKPPLHALEFYFEVFTNNFTLKTGQDPELNIIKEARWFDWKEIIELPDNQIPKFIKKFINAEQLLMNKNFINLLNGAFNANNG